MKRVVINILLLLTIVYAGWQAYQWEQDIFKQIAVGDANDVVALLDKNASLHKAFSNEYDTVLMAAILKNQPKVFESLLDVGADPNLKNQFGDSAMWAAIQVDTDMFLQRLLDYGGNVHIHNDQLKRPLIFGALGSWNASKLDLLIEYGADINARNEMGKTPMMSAASTKQYDVVIKLLDLGAQFGLADNNGRTLTRIIERSAENFALKQGELRITILQRIAPNSEYLKGHE